MDTYRKQLSSILTSTDERLALCVGPCSLHDEKSSLLYAEKLKKLSEKVPHFIVMRAFFEKSRTSLGWKGYLYTHGIDKTRMLLEKLSEFKLPLACEFVTPHLAHHFEDLITWGFIGARSVTAQAYRDLATQLSMPIGMKNTTNGDINAAIHAVLVSGAGGPVFDSDHLIHAPGNPYTHAVLRGSDFGPNVDDTTIDQLHRALNKRLLIDCSHGNSGRDPEKQALLFEKCIQNPDPRVFGYMLESHVEPSLTDPCLSWEETTRLLSAMSLKKSACCV